MRDIKGDVQLEQRRGSFEEGSQVIYLCIHLKWEETTACSVSLITVMTVVCVGLYKTLCTNKPL